MNLTDDMLQSAATDVCNAMLDSLSPAESSNHQFSLQFEQRMHKLIRRQKRWYRFLQRAAMIILALLIGSGIWLSIDANASSAFLKWVQNVYENSIVYRFFNNTNEKPKLEQFQPSWLPEGYTKENLFTLDFQILTEYSNADGDVIYFHCMEMSEYSQLETVIDGMMPPTEVTVNGMQGIFYEAEDRTQFNELIWFDNEHDVAFRISSSLEKSTMLLIAENVF